MSFRVILVPTDFSEDADRALELALELARPSGAALVLLHSCNLGPHIGILPEPIAIPISVAEHIRATARERLAEREQRVLAAGLKCTVQLADSEAVAAILCCAQSTAADLIAMGTRGFTGLRHVLLGSVAERVVRLAPCAVLTAKAGHSERPAPEPPTRR